MADMVAALDDIDPDVNVESTPLSDSTIKKKHKKKKNKDKDKEKEKKSVRAEPPEGEEDNCTFSDGQLSCAGQDWTEVPCWVGEKYGAKARRVDLCYNELNTLKNLDGFTNCEELVLDNNNLGDDISLPSIPGLHTLTLNKNRISDTEKFLTQIKQRYPKLAYLSLLGNEACPNELVLKDEDDYKRYRYFVLYHLPGLKFLDSRATTKAEHAEAQRVGQFMKVVSVSQDDVYQGQETGASDSKPSQFSPLPSEGRDASSHRGTIGTCKYVYYGKHSEGNRFIRNNDL